MSDPNHYTRFDDQVLQHVCELEKFTLSELTEEVTSPTDPEIPGWAATADDVYRSLRRLRRDGKVAYQFDPRHFLYVSDLTEYGRDVVGVHPFDATPHEARELIECIGGLSDGCDVPPAEVDPNAVATRILVAAGVLDGAPEPLATRRVLRVIAKAVGVPSSIISPEGFSFRRLRVATRRQLIVLCKEGSR